MACQGDRTCIIMCVHPCVGSNPRPASLAQASKHVGAVFCKRVPSVSHMAAVEYERMRHSGDCNVRWDGRIGHVCRGHESRDALLVIYRNLVQPFVIIPKVQPHTWNAVALSSPCGAAQKDLHTSWHQPMHIPSTRIFNVQESFLGFAAL